MPSEPAPPPLRVEVAEDAKASPGNLIGALAALLLDLARKKCQTADRRDVHADDKADMTEVK
jgi:hypothetical protein